MGNISLSTALTIERWEDSTKLNWGRNGVARGKKKIPESLCNKDSGMPSLANPTEVDTIWGNMLQVFYNIVGVNENKYYLLHIPQCRLFIRTKIFVILSSTSVRNVI